MSGPHDVLIQVRTPASTSRRPLAPGLNPEARSRPYILEFTRPGGDHRSARMSPGCARAGASSVSLERGYAEKVAVPAGQVFPIPDSIP